MPTGVYKHKPNQLFQKGHVPTNPFPKGYNSNRSKESYRLGTLKMAETRKRLGSYRWSDSAKKKAHDSHVGKKQPWSRDNIIRLMTTGKIKKFDTLPELKMKDMLKAWGYEYEFQKILKGVICDFFIPSKNAIIHVDGEYWHKYPFGRDN